MVKIGLSKRDKKGNSEKKRVKYVYATKGAIFIVTGELKESKYSYAVEIRPLYGKFYDAKEKKTYNAEELREYKVYLNVRKEMEELVDALKRGKPVLWGYDDDEFIQIPKDVLGGEKE
ncbi:hypothetical protein [Sulfolobus acidocaldarius]|uniref:Uncharacterized protein n=3 Tax=Sulfolobus acidocaldarius TaxID=2285 RepID=Q4J8N5_SULAC|nr:hypothetical protein [Sulfolobus acidocaldarius]AAY80842.1 hypothetical protein Saci_1524 [Sulfolobus acidocaldarius DSM 639]AGE71443.1 hypothetical protein SacN8_07400 [Sulfolobus acidocaldarius N8]AGE73716.1 hypothetical protein SacRon12I_07410 [Sulfolobus acidocaldarius Ron12/I]WCM35353.1 hypothetical protein GO597_08470 [Sulfolobus acidocaldarius DSM 639]